MNDYSRGYAAGLKAAAALVPTDETRELCCNGYDCECRKPEDAAFVSAEVEARRIKQAILSLPIQGEAEGSGPCVVVPVEVCRFLLGEAPLEGEWFGDGPAGGRYWWRAVLRKYMPTVDREEHAHR